MTESIEKIPIPPEKAIALAFMLSFGVHEWYKYMRQKNDGQIIELEEGKDYRVLD